MRKYYTFTATFDGDVSGLDIADAENKAHQLIYDVVRNGDFKIELTEVEPDED